MNWDSCEDPKNSRIAAMTGFALIRSCGIAVAISWYTDIFSLMARSIRTRPMRNWFSSSSPTERTRRLPRWSMSSTSCARGRTWSRKPSTGLGSLRLEAIRAAGGLDVLELEDLLRQRRRLAELGVELQ